MTVNNHFVVSTTLVDAEAIIYIPFRFFINWLCYPTHVLIKTTVCVWDYRNSG